MKLVYRILFWLLGLMAAFILLVVIVGWSYSAPVYKGPKTEYFNGDTFENIGGIESKSMFGVMKWMLTRDQGEWKEILEDEVTFAEKPAERVGDSLVVTYVNHSTFLIQTDSLNILTDPIWADRASPVSFAGPKRMAPAGVRFDDLPHIDLVVISHNHYDHLDVSTLTRINEKFGSRFITPLGVGQFLNSEGIQNTHDVEWWQEDKVTDKVKVTSVPAQHFSSRGLFDRDKTLWAGYVLETSAGNIYFAGDTGYGNFFKDIGERYSIKLGLIPIGAYKPRWFMSPMHVSPREALLVHNDIGAEMSIGMHFATFPLADDGQNDPVNDLNKALDEYGEDKPDFRYVPAGEVLIIK